MRTDADGTVWQHGQEANDQAEAAAPLDVMPVPYADLQVSSLTSSGDAMSGQPLAVTWNVVNDGIGVTSSAGWSDSVWLSTDPDGGGQTWALASASHLGQLGVGEGYQRTLDVTLPQGLSGTYYLNVAAAGAGGGPFEFTHGGNNRGTPIAIPVTLSPSPDLVVQDVSLPATASENDLVDVSWTVLNAGVAQATGAWGDPVTVILACGVTVPGPSTLECQTVEGVDWLIDDSEAPRYRFTTYGRAPAVEVYLDYDPERTSSADILRALAPAVSQLPVHSTCTPRS